MRASRAFTTLILLSAVFAAPVHAASPLAERLQKSTTAFEELMASPDEAVPVDLLKKAEAVVIFPGTLNLAWGIGGQYGKGVLLRHDKKRGTWGPPVFYSIGGLTIGPQIGGQAIDIVLVVTSEKGLQSLLESKCTLGADAGLALGPAGRNATASTDLGLKAEMYSYSRAKGLYIGLSLKGAVVKPDRDAIEAYYGDGVTAADVLNGKRLPRFKEHKALVSAIAKRTPVLGGAAGIAAITFFVALIAGGAFFWWKGGRGLSAILVFLLWTGSAHANETLAETILPVPIVELFTSEGCSSCPPADKWLSTLQHDKALWTEFVPVAFHVDYWDKAGWKDRFSSPEHTERQRGYARRLRSDTIYTPAMFVNGVEWRGWSRGQAVPSPGGEARGILKLETFGDDEFQITFRPTVKDGGTWTAYAALLAFDLKTQVKDGENRGKMLKHDFTCVGFESKQMDKVSFGYRALIAPKRLPNTRSARSGLAVWVSRGGDVLPVQAAGAYLPSEEKVA